MGFAGCYDTESDLSQSHRPRSAECLWIWIHTLQGPFLAVFATELGERNANKTCTLKGVICTVCYCTGLIKNWLNIFIVALAAYDDDDVKLNVLGCRVDILGTNCDQCKCMVQCCFTSIETIRLVRTGSPRRPPRLSHSSSLNPGCPCVKGSPL